MNTEYHYVVENGQKVEVHAESDYIMNLKQQYYVREPNGQLTKVVGDAGYEERVKQRTIQNKQAAPTPPMGPTAGPPTVTSEKKTEGV